MPKKHKPSKGSKNDSIVVLDRKLGEQFWKNGWWLLIEHASNGFVLTANGEFGDDGEHMPFYKTVVEEPDILYDQQKQTAELAKRLLYEVVEHFGLDPGKHAKYRVSIEVEEKKDDE